MMTKLIGQVLFPRLAPWEQERRAGTVMLVVLTTVGFATIIGFMMYWINSRT